MTALRIWRNSTARCEHLAGLGLGTGQRPRLAASVASAEGRSVQEVLGPAEEQVKSGARALSCYAAAAGVGATAGLVLGGLVADLVSWRVGFFINLPIGIALMIAARRHIAETPKRTGRLDVSGAVSSTLGMTALVYGIVRSAEAGWADPSAIASLAVGIALTALFIFNESRAPQPILPLRLFASRERSGAYAARVLFLGGMVGFWFFTTQYLQGVLGYSPLKAGLAFLPTTLPNFAAAMMVPRLTRKLGNGGLLAAGLAVGIVGMLWLGQASAHTSYLTGVALPMILIGLGQGGVLAPLTASGVAGAASEDTGAASGLVNVAHQLGGSLGLGVLIAVFAAAAPSSLVGPDLLAHRIAAAIDAGAMMLSIALVIGLALIVPACTRRAAAKTSRADLESRQPAASLDPGTARPLPRIMSKDSRVNA